MTRRGSRGAVLAAAVGLLLLLAGCGGAGTGAEEPSSPSSVHVASHPSPHAASPPSGRVASTPSRVAKLLVIVFENHSAHRAMYEETGPDGKRAYTVAQIATEFGVTRPTIYRHLAHPEQDLPRSRDSS